GGHRGGGGGGHAVVEKPARAPHEHLPASDTGGEAPADDVACVAGDAAHHVEPGRCGVAAKGGGDGVGLAGLGGGGERHERALGEPAEGGDVHHGRLAGGERAGLVEDHHVGAGEQLEVGRALDEHAAAGGHGDGGERVGGHGDADAGAEVVDEHA